jgi:sorting nexin-29
MSENFRYIATKEENVMFVTDAPTEEKIGSYRYGFRPGKRTTDALFIIQQILEKAQESETEIHFLFVDFKAAYDSVIRKQLYKLMNELGIPEKPTRIVTTTMENSSSSTRLQNSFLDPLEVTNGLKQGDALACLLSNVALQRSL